MIIETVHVIKRIFIDHFSLTNRKLFHVLKIT